MKKMILFYSFILLLIASVSAFAFAPKGSKVTSLTVNTSNVNMINDKSFMVDTPTACQLRLKQNAAQANSAVTKIALRANSTYVFDVNRATPYANLSGCTSGVLVRE